MAKLTRSVEIDAPVEKVFDFAADVGRFWTSWPEEVAVRDVDLRPGGVGSSARVFSHFYALHLEGTIEYTEVVPNERILAAVHFFGEKPRWEFTFEPVDGGTKMTGTGEWRVKLPFVGKRLERMMVKGHEEGLESLLDTVKTRVETEATAAV